MPLASRIRATLDAFEKTYGLPRGWAVAITAAGVLIVPAFAWLLALANTHQRTFRLLCREDGPVEITTVVSFLAASIVGALLALRAHRHREATLIVSVYAGFAVLCFLLAMEEISWGQTLFNYRTPLGLRDVNEQGELNVHNLPGVMELLPLFLFMAGAAGLAAIRFCSTPRLRKVRPPEFLAPILVVVALTGALSAVVNLAFIQYSFDLIVGMLEEAVEMLIAISSLLYVWLNGRMLAREWREAGARDPAP